MTKLLSALTISRGVGTLAGSHERYVALLELPPPKFGIVTPCCCPILPCEVSTLLSDALEATQQVEDSTVEAAAPRSLGWPPLAAPYLSPYTSLAAAHQRRRQKPTQQ